MTIDWHGENAKQKRDSAVRRATLRAFLVGTIVALAVVAGVVSYLAAQPQPTEPAQVTVVVVATLLPTNTPDPRTATAQEAIARTQIAIALTGGAPPREPSKNPTLVADQAPSSLPEQLMAFQYDPSRAADQRLTAIRTLPISAKAGYHFFGARFNRQGLLYIAHAYSDLQQNTCTSPYSTDDAYWIIDVSQSPAKLVGQLRSPMMVSPKQIAFDSADNAYVLAADCQQRTYAIFYFDANGRWLDTFPILGASDLTVTADDTLLVAENGYADTSIPQAHLIALRSDANGTMHQMADYKQGNPKGLYLALLAAGDVFAVWSEPKVPARLIQWPSHAFSTKTPDAPDFNPDPSQGIAINALDNLVSVGGDLFGLSLTRRAIYHIALADRSSQLVPFGQLYARTFAVSGDLWVLAGPPDPG